MRLNEEAYLAHYGILRKSGRYPWGSGKTPLQRSRTFLDITEDLKKNHGMKDTEIAAAFSTKEHPFTTAHLRALRSRSSNIVTLDRIHTAEKLKEKGMGNSAIARQMGINESTVRSLLAPGRKEQLDIHESIADMLKRQVDEKGMVDVGAQVYRDLPLGDNPGAPFGVSADKFKTALIMLEEEGYNTHPLFMPQQGTGELTRYRVLAKPGMTKQDVWENRFNLRQISEKSPDGGRTFDDMSVVPPLSISSKRVGIKYKEDGGADADGVIYVRPGVPDLSMGKSHYAQVRIAVDGSHYLKGMAIYKNDLPKGVDLQFNTNKSNTGNKFDAMKPFKKDELGNVDPVNPFGAAIKLGGQIKDANNKAISVMNRINDEGDWDTWSKTLSSQVLSKQSPDLIKTQLDFTHDRRREELEKIKALTNPLVKKKLLEAFAEETDSAAVDLKAASMPGQATRVIMPVKSMKTTEIFAPTFENGTRVALIRFPHAGRFEIPELTVNNRNREAKELFGINQGRTARDAVGIHPKVAEHLSGADFDGDHVVVIPNNRKSITKIDPLEGLKGFDPQKYKVPKTPSDERHPDGSLKYPDGKPIIDNSRKQKQMGNITNLISDMTIRGANRDEIARAVRHSMVVIDSEKHNLDYKRSERDNGIRDLKRRYQGVAPGGQLRGASTLITRATAEKYVEKRKPTKPKDGGPIDPKTGAKRFTPTGETSVKYKRDGKTVVKSFRSREEADDFIRREAPDGVAQTRMIKSKRLAETPDAFSLVSKGRGTREEELYAEHSNRLKAMANEARLEFLNTKLTKYSPSAKKAYAKEVESLNASLNRALLNAPRERQAQVIAGMIVKQRKQANPHMEPETEKRIRGQALDEARIRTGAKKDRIKISPQEWEAIQAGAISNDKLGDILRNTDAKVIRDLATPRKATVMTSVKLNRAKAMLNSGATLSEVAAALGVPLSTLNSSLTPKEGK